MQIKELKKISQPSSSETFKWFHPEDANEIMEVDGKKLLIFGMSDGSLLGFEYQSGDQYKSESYIVYEVIL